MDYPDEDLTRLVIGAFHRVYNKLGPGFLERVYIGALELELRKLHLRVQREVPVPVFYDNVIVGTYRVDLLVEGRLVLELKSGSENRQANAKQILHYLRSTRLELGLVLQFDDAPKVRRFIYRNSLKET